MGFRLQLLKHEFAELNHKESPMIREKLNKVLAKLLNIHEAKVLEVTRLGENFQSLRFQWDSIKKSDWQAGDKIQIAFNLSGRTYTPLFWDSEKGESELLAYTRTPQTLASLWFHSLKKDDRFQFYGPRSSLLVDELQGDLVFFGDETSFSTAHTVKNAKAGKEALQFFFEVSDPDESAKMLSYLGIENATLISKQPGELQRLANEFTRMLLNNDNSTLVVTGRTLSIQTLRQCLRQKGISMKRLKVKAYWADGKKGLD